MLRPEISGQTMRPQSPMAAAGETPLIASTPPMLTKAQFRNPPASTKYSRRNMDRRRRQENSADNRNGSGGTADLPLTGDWLNRGMQILVQLSTEPHGTTGTRITSLMHIP